MNKTKIIGMGIVICLLTLLIPTGLSEPTNDSSGDEIEFSEEDGPYRLTVLFCPLGSFQIFFFNLKYGMGIGPLIFMTKNGRMAFNCINGYEKAFVNGKNIEPYLEDSVSRRIEGYGFKGIQIYPLISIGRCIYIDIL